MGWQQYSRIWGLSRHYPHILYRKQLTAGMRGEPSIFHKQPDRCFSSPPVLEPGGCLRFGPQAALRPEGIRLDGKIPWPRKYPQRFCGV
jgi:hypothetical protein